MNINTKHNTTSIRPLLHRQNGNREIMPVDQLCLAILSLQFSEVKRLVEEEGLNPSQREENYSNSALPMHHAMFVAAKQGDSGYAIFKYLKNLGAEYNLRTSVSHLQAPRGCEWENENAKVNVAEYGMQMICSISDTRKSLYNFNTRNVRKAIDDLGAPQGPSIPKEFIPKPVVDRYESLLNAPFADIFFEIDDARIPAHKNVLANASKVFAAMFQCGEEQVGNGEEDSTHEGERDVKRRKKGKSNQKSTNGGGGMKEVQTSTITPQGDGLTAKDIEIFLRYMYCGRLDETLMKDHVEQLIGLAEQYGVHDLKDLCENNMCQQVGVDDVIPYLQLGTLYKATKLKHRCHTIIKTNAAKLMVTPEFMALSQQAPMIWTELTKVLTNE